MIGHLRGLIKNAKEEIENLELEIKNATEELGYCKELKPILARIGDDASNGYYSLQVAANSLNKGIKIAGEGQGSKITERANLINNLSQDASAAIGNVALRITELENNILE